MLLTISFETLEILYLVELNEKQAATKNISVHDDATKLQVKLRFCSKS